ncbi:class I SAM-dependent methyltransferase [Chthonobacter rhizosphaerae]|uniref:class I SAM-dependent methyltransferase n=1 Tax=Chthonobacter rhizosphaerae TaxID=2735553 RepID=UPI0015EF5335|nr:class I SAM-dependent methyltransferase [Chthonobacter rhizosphaerae]
MNAHGAGANYSIRDEIRDYWSERAATFDTQVGHEIASEAERRAWHALLRRHLGDGAGRRALDLASGTGVVSHLLHDLGFDVTGLDWAEPMLERARAKARARGTPIRFVMGDAERTMEPAESYDVVVTRHLVWTLVDPAAAFRDWHQVLKPGGRLLVVDGDFVSPTLLGRATAALTALAARLGLGARAPADPLRERHRRILEQVYFRHGARADAVAALLREAGFRQTTVDTNLGAIHRAQARHLPLMKGFDRATQHRYAVVAVK